MWKSEAIPDLSAFSAEKTVVTKDEIPTEKLHAIGQLTLRMTFKKKSLG
jgi:hypothetical protein